MWEGILNLDYHDGWSDLAWADSQATMMNSITFLPIIALRVPRLSHAVPCCGMQACDGQLAQVKLSWKPEAALTVVMAAKGYPGSYKKGTPINNLEAATTAKVFHAGTSTDASGQLVANGGRVLGVTALGADVAAAQAAAYEAVGKIDWEDAYYRKDIGWRAVARLREGAAAAAGSSS
mgnify:CR=1 FL=1